MIDTIKTIYDLLAASSDITSLLSTFGAGPAIFTGKYVPAAAGRPYIWIPGPASDVADEAKDIAGRDVLIDVIAVADDAGSSLEVDSLADAARDALNRAKPSVAGADVWRMQISGPTVYESGEGVIARRLQVRMGYYVT